MHLEDSALGFYFCDVIITNLFAEKEAFHLKF